MKPLTEDGNLAIVFSGLLYSALPFMYCMLDVVNLSLINLHQLRKKGGTGNRADSWFS